MGRSEDLRIWPSVIQSSQCKLGSKVCNLLLLFHRTWFATSANKNQTSFESVALSELLG